MKRPNVAHLQYRLRERKSCESKISCDQDERREKRPRETRRDAEENWRNLGPVAARRAKSFGGTSLVLFNRLLLARGDIPRSVRNPGFVKSSYAPADGDPPSAETWHIDNET
jgi:hypothetical protein